MGSCWRLGPGKEGGGVSFRSVGSGVRAPGSELAPLTCAPAGQQPSPLPPVLPPRAPPHHVTRVLFLKWKSLTSPPCEIFH